MDIVIPLHQWTITGDSELKYTLRGFQQFMDHDDVYIIGPKLPSWATGLKLVPFLDTNDPKFREYNIYAKVKYFSDHASIRQPFIYANDDHFLLAKFDGVYYQKGWLRDVLSTKSAGDPYRKTIINTMLLFPKSNNFDVHYPMVIDPDKLDNIKVDWKKSWGYCMKTLYCNFNRLSGPKNIDWKFNEILSKESILEEINIKADRFFSTSDKAFDVDMISIMEDLYPDKSPYEK